MKQTGLLVRACCLLILVTLLGPIMTETVTSGNSSSSQLPTSSPHSKKKRSEEDIMFGNQQNKQVSGMVDGLFQSSENSSKNNSQTKSATKQDTETPQLLASLNGKSVSGNRHVLSELPDRLNDYDYMQLDSSDSSGGSSPSISVDDDRLKEEEEVAQMNLNSFFAPPEPQELPSFDPQKLMVDPEQIERNELGVFPVTVPEFESPSKGLLYRRLKRGAFHRVRSPLEDLLAPSGGPFRKRRASSISMRLKRDLTSNKLLNWLALLHKNQAANSRQATKEEIAFQEFQGLKPEPLELPGGSGYLYEPLDDEEELDDDDGFAASVLTLPEDDPYGGLLDRDLFHVRAPPQRRSSPFYPLDYRYVVFPGARKRANLLSAPGGRFGAMREVNRWPGEPQSGRWGQFPLLAAQHYQSRLGLPVVVRRAHPHQENDEERLYSLASLLAAPGASSRDFELDPDEVRERRRRSTRPSSVASRG